VFEAGASAEATINEAPVDLLYRQIGQLRSKTIFWHASSATSRAKRRGMDFLRVIRPRAVQAFERRFETPPGKQAQVDFAYFRTVFTDQPGAERII
jgi:hypothetical protein